MATKRTASTKRTSAKKAKEQEKAFYSLPEGWKITNARERNDQVYFTLKMPGLSLYNLKIVDSEEYGEFIGMPSDWNGKKGKASAYFNRFALYLSPEDQETVIGAAYEALEDGDEDEEDD